jgi:hypothetical protein
LRRKQPPHDTRLAWQQPMRQILPAGPVSERMKFQQ